MAHVDFTFCLTKNNQGSYDISIKYQSNGKSCAILLDTTSAWIELVKNELNNGMTTEEIVNRFRDNEWDDLENDPKYGFRTHWKKLGGEVCEKSYRQAVELYFATLKVIADGVFAGMKKETAL